MAVRNYSLAQVQTHNKRGDCWVIYKGKVYDITEFMPDHPGGDDLILKYGGKDITEIMSDVLEHEHSEVAYEILLEHEIGEFTTRFEGERARLHRRRIDLLEQETEYKTYVEEDFVPSVTDVNADVKAYEFLDLRKALVPQIMRASYTKEFYLEQVHKPRYLPTPAIFFGHPLLEPLTKTAWYVVPATWLPYVGYQIYRSLDSGLPWATTAYFALGIFIWTLLEYGLHRFLFHFDDWMPNYQFAYVIHFTLHGFHHYLPMDRMRLVVPPALFIILAYPWVSLAYVLFPPIMAHAIIAGAIFGYILYDMTHYYVHHAKVWGAHFREMKKHHLAHHYKDFEAAYGITSKFWDRLFGTGLSYKY
ncbi:fatty acid alpha-hydroxylase [Apophysomyces sp. BC1034]|nr:fatty acid alpha-hydroxylase [Apophysomyces sp. BC1015]KAG0177110.1 fatty acid alpha-hydroxylase [Apophysomyces sp. BC1021]KAG0187406.1 fatty acid alpha-hydroxylase [Apophysomyces sp. BC1034]